MSELYKKIGEVARNFNNKYNYWFRPMSSTIVSTSFERVIGKRQVGYNVIVPNEEKVYCIVSLTDHYKMIPNSPYKLTGI